MKLAYVAGPYRAAHGRSVIENIRAAEQVAMKYWRRGYAVICPHLNTAFFDGIVPDEVFLEGDLEMVRRVDVVIMMARWEQSKGAVAEHALAQELKKEIVYE